MLDLRSYLWLIAFARACQPVGAVGLGRVALFGAFAFEHTTDAAHHAAQRQLAALIGKQDLSRAPAAVVPALQQRDVLVQFGGGSWRGQLSRRQRFGYARFQRARRLLA